MGEGERQTMKSLLRKIEGLRVLVIGDLMLDHYIWGDATRISPEAPVPVVEVARDSYAAGGAANVALNINAIGGKAELCGWTGRDEAGRTLQQLFRESGVSYDADCFTSHRPTIVKTRVIVQSQQLCRLDRDGRFDDDVFDAKIFSNLEQRIRVSDTVILSDYAKGFLRGEMLNRIIQEARNSGRFVSLDPKPKRSTKFRGIDLLTPNRMEALQLAGLHADPRDAFPSEAVCRILWEKFAPGNLVITLGNAGMLLSREGRVLRTIPTAAREVFDVSGAGDTVVATLGAALAVGADLEEAAHFANAAAGVVVGKVGTATATPEEILACFDR